MLLTSFEEPGAQNRIRTDDLILTKDVLYQLSYLGVIRKWSKNEKRSGDRGAPFFGRQLQSWPFFINDSGAYAEGVKTRRQPLANPHVFAQM